MTVSAAAFIAGLLLGGVIVYASVTVSYAARRPRYRRGGAR